MKHSLFYSNQYPVYPGEYIPMPEARALLKKLKIKDHLSRPLANMDELKNCYVVRVIIPGTKREDIFVDIDKNILSIVAFYHEVTGNRKQLKLHEFESNNFERHIALPPNADSIFVNAEYKEGILFIYVPKSKNPVKNLRSRIVVY